MISTIIEHVIRLRVLVWFLVLAGVLLSVQAIRTASLDAIPDLSDPQIVVYAKWPRSPRLLETEVTAPLIKTLIGSPDVRSIRGISHMGYSFIYVVLTDESVRDKVQQRVVDRINAMRPQLPSDAVVTLGPKASSMGWTYQYALVDRDGTRDLRELRLLNENQIKSGLQTVPGVAEVASVGGLEKQYQLKVFPPLMAKAGISLTQLVTAVQNVFQEAGGRTIEVTNRDYQLRGVIRSDNIDDLEFLVVGRTREGTPVRLKEIGYVQVGYDLRRSIADLDGKGEVVGGIVIMEQLQNVLAVTRSVEQRLEQIRASLPRGIEIVTTYNRSALIWETLRNFFAALVYEFLVVIVVIAAPLGNLRASIAPICVLLLGALFTMLPMSAFHQTINLFSLAGLSIAVGEMADATIVIVENCSAKLSRGGSLGPAEKRETIIRATATMTRPLLFSMLIMVTSFLPIFFLGEREGRLFNPLAYSKTFAMAFSTLLTLFVLPVIIVWVFQGSPPETRKDREHAVVRAYRAALNKTIQHRYPFLFASVLVLIVAVVLFRGFEKDYLPEMDEGSILYMPTTLPGLPVREAGWILQQMDRKLKEFPEVDRVFGKLGRADTATDPAPVAMIETTILLQPKSKWRKGMTKEKLVADMNAALQIVGYANTWTQPISARVLMQATGIQTPVGIKVKGSESAVIEDISQRIEGLLRGFPGTKSILAERVAEGYFVDADFDLKRMAEYGIAVDEAMFAVRYAIGGENVVGIRQPDNTIIPLGLQYSPEYIDTLEKIRSTPILTPDGRSIPLHAIADVSVRKMPEMVRNDNGELAGYIYVDLGNVTAPDYVERAQPFLAKNLTLPPGYSLEWTGLYQYEAEARRRLQFVVPLTLVIMFGLLLMTFRSVADSSLIMLSAPFALVGGIVLQWKRGYSLTTAVIIGYVSLFAVAIQTGIIMIEFIREALANRTATQSYMEAVVQGSVARLRPKLMTVATTVLGLIPIMFSSGSGMDITQPIATPTFGGMISSTLYVLFLIPCLFAVGEDIRHFRQKRVSLAAAPPVSSEVG